MQVLNAHDTYLLEFPYVATHSLVFSLIFLVLYLSLMYIWQSAILYLYRMLRTCARKLCVSLFFLSIRVAVNVNEDCA